MFGQPMKSMMARVAHIHQPMKRPLGAMSARRFSTKNRNFSSMLQVEKNTFDYDYNPQIAPQYWRGKLPESIKLEEFTIDCQGDISKMDGDYIREKMQAHFDGHQLVYLRNTGVTKMTDLKKYIDNLMNASEYIGGANSRDKQELEPFFYETGAPLSANLHYHHEMSYTGKSISKISFACFDSPKTNALSGSTFLCDSVGLTDAIMKTDLGKKLRDKGVCYWRNLTDREGNYTPYQATQVYNHWQQSFGTECPVEAKKLAEERGLQVSWGTDYAGNDRYMLTKYYASAFEYAPNLDRNIMYATIADHFSWFDSWPGVKDLKPTDRPIKMTYGDDTELTWDEWQQWVSLQDDWGFPIEWKKGDAVVICNYRFAHGRPSIHLKPDEKRELGVVLGTVFDRVGDLPNKW